jgi:hypothetical protein
MIAELLRCEEDDPKHLRQQIETRLFEHQLELMTDATLIDPADMSAVSSFVSRDTMPPAVESILHEFGLSETEQSSPRRNQSSNWIGRLTTSKKNSRSHLQKWSLRYLRAHDFSRELGAVESELEAQDFSDSHSDPVEFLKAALAKHMKTRMRAPEIDALIEFENALLEATGNPRRPWILLASSVRCITEFVANVIQFHAPETHWSENGEEDQPLYVQTGDRQIVRTDPALRVVRFINKGTKALLSDYAKHVIRQSSVATA